MKQYSLGGRNTTNLTSSSHHSTLHFSPHGFCKNMAHYIGLKLDRSLSVCLKHEDAILKYLKNGSLQESELVDAILKFVLQGKLTYLHCAKGQEMAPTLGENGGTLLVRKRVYVGDVVLLKDPKKSENYLVRRVAANGGYEMASSDEKDESFALEDGECWVLADNEKLKPKEANDSRIFGLVHMTNIVGRAIYCLRTAVDHGPVQNSKVGMREDSTVLQVELNVEEMLKKHQA